MLRKTALYEEHQKLGGRLIDFGGWELPVQYSGVMNEHLACRSHAGIFDVSHMGEFHVEGKDSTEFLNYLVTNDVSRLSIGQALYTVMCQNDGGIVDDLVIYRRSLDKYLVVVNASNTEKDFQHCLQVRELYSGKKGDLLLANVSAEYTQIAVQGRIAEAILSKLTDAPIAKLKNYWFLEGNLLGHIPAIIGRTGYTGEDGFEIYVNWNSGPEIWKALLLEGKPFGLLPCGLGARDTLRLEMKYPLYGNELSDKTNPLEAGLSWVVKLAKGDFLGKSALIELKEKGMNRQLMGLTLLDKGIPRHGYAIYDAEGANRIGEITSGTQSPSLKKSIAIGYIDAAHGKLGARLTVDIRGTKVAAEVIPTPFYRRDY